MQEDVIQGAMLTAVFAVFVYVNTEFGAKYIRKALGWCFGAPAGGTEPAIVGKFNVAFWVKFQTDQATYMPHFWQGLSMFLMIFAFDLHTRLLQFVSGKGLFEYFPLVEA